MWVFCMLFMLSLFSFLFIIAFSTHHVSLLRSVLVDTIASSATHFFSFLDAAV